MHAKNSEKVPVTTRAEKSAVFETLSRKKKTTEIHTKNSEKVRAQKRERVFRDPFTRAEKEDDGYLR